MFEMASDANDVKQLFYRRRKKKLCVVSIAMLAVKDLIVELDLIRMPMLFMI